MFKEYIEKQIETLSEEDNQVSYDRIRDYNEILERGIFRTFDGVKTLRVFKAGDVVHTLHGYDSEREGAIKVGDKWVVDTYVKLMSRAKSPNLKLEGIDLVATRDINEDDYLTLNR